MEKGLTLLPPLTLTHHQQEATVVFDQATIAEAFAFSTTQIVGIVHEKGCTAAELEDYLKNALSVGLFLTLP